ncbi:phosphatase PAP2 family protein [Mesorhizobium sp. M2D.F.Ca.ET.185.01.1.1]|uniref:phosphatase PAP2 family protein n=1 Tax=unclassified Mesorhizobium TaxID=325217 RepID=UPI000FCA3455|nr:MULTISPECIES: phosphatase PAP2 family protein [unclassified Mesorhizobium]TGP57278.1 phosphatase PAP2 family protein [bacterium M00.F.Ca.ET.230.01.1.1]TGP77065.1 phosphatase PAP2 family protein [bacterium M00.F.Ca.ET.227.01.1.1]TGP84068.1 phosphatase PAP2 family protein [bacterium M00.F.Ca.ET.221.01.1.1]TGP88581.1 phosphatase PAP2 family protein [bacterium M00.F.Ca.ET.222.01.1.1]TGT70738.1 phosphatase PAP2 family protein [bacterium M00.F.Ca.ET.159.01.1.1]TGT82381.1 phosphatase PAP2 family 
MDVSLTHWINAAAGISPLLDRTMITISQIGVPLMVIAVALQWWSRNDRLHVRHACLSAGLSFLLGLAINQAILLFVHRIRPYDAGVTHLLIAPSADWSFPSDHATASIAIVAAFAMQALPRRTLALLVMAVLICWSRLHLGIHYAGDIAGGAATGIAAALAVRLCYRENSRLDAFATKVL